MTSTNMTKKNPNKKGLICSRSI